MARDTRITEKDGMSKVEYLIESTDGYFKETVKRTTSRPGLSVLVTCLFPDGQYLKCNEYYFLILIIFVINTK